MDKKNTASTTPTLLKISSLRPFEEHPYNVQGNEEMDTLVESIKENGVPTQLIVRPIKNTDEYEVIGGHGRLNAAKKTGFA